MNAPKEPLLMDHDADGITELDNQLPRWWLWLFILCVVWAFGYLVYFEVTRLGQSSAEEYAAEMAAAQAAWPAPAVDAAPAVPSSEAAVIAVGQSLFLKNCVACHGPQGGGLIGPNLCDEFFLHGSTFPDMIHTIREGVLTKGMISWKTVLKPHEIQAVASFAWTLRGTTPAAPKPPEGVKAEPPAPAEPAAEIVPPAEPAS